MNIFIHPKVNPLHKICERVFTAQNAIQERKKTKRVKVIRLYFTASIYYTYIMHEISLPARSLHLLFPIVWDFMNGKCMTFSRNEEQWSKGDDENHLLLDYPSYYFYFSSFANFRSLFVVIGACWIRLVRVCVNIHCFVSFRFSSFSFDPFVFFIHAFTYLTIPHIFVFR